MRDTRCDERLRRLHSSHEFDRTPDSVVCATAFLDDLNFDRLVCAISTGIWRGRVAAADRRP